MRIAVVAPSCSLKPEAAERVRAIVTERRDCELFIHPQSFLTDGHFAGPDEARLSALREVMADPSVDAVWFARGGYGSNRIAEAALADMSMSLRGWITEDDELITRGADGRATTIAIRGFTDSGDATEDFSVDANGVAHWKTAVDSGSAPFGIGGVSREASRQAGPSAVGRSRGEEP